MNRNELSKALSQSTALSNKKAEELIVAFCKTIENALIRDEKVVYSNFGTFYKVHYPSKVIFHPKLGRSKQMVMLPTDAVKWMPSGNIKDLVNSEVEIEGSVARGTRKANSALLSKKPKSTLAPSQEEVVNEMPIETPKMDTNAPTAEIATELPVEIPVKKVLAKQPITPEANVINPPQKEDTNNIYEELMNKEVTKTTPRNTMQSIKGSSKSFFGKVFGGADNVASTPDNKEAKQPVSLRDSGIFGANTKSPSELPIQQKSLNNIPVPPAVPTESIELDESPTENIAIRVKNSINPEALPPQKVEPIPAQIEHEINPFATEKPNISYFDLSKVTIVKELLQKIPEKLARKYKMVPVEEDKDQLVVAMADPQDIEAKELVKKMTQKEISVRLSSEEDINHVLDQYTGLDSELHDAIQTADDEHVNEGEDEKNLLIESASDNAPAARIVNSLLQRAIRDKASDIHIEPSEKEVVVRLRRDGVLKKAVTIPHDIQSAIISRIKILCNMKIDEQRLPQDGRFSITCDNRKVDFRVSSMPIANGEKIVMRVLDKLTGILTIEQLGIRGKGLEVLKDNLKKSHGMTLVTGPTGSGKTTTLYALIDSLYSEGVNIVTLEDPIEYRMPGINQSQVNSDIEYTFASGLRSIVRQDPDIIMIGEIRDPETAEMSVHAALTGHIVLSTLHTNDSSGAAPRLLDMGVEPFLLTSSLNTVVAQRLARKICDDCKEEIALSDVELKQVQAEIAKMPADEQKNINLDSIKFQHGKGCKNCDNSGYKGRIGLYEILGISDAIRDSILKKESSGRIEEIAIGEGMVTMLQDGIIKAINGITTLEEVWRTTKE